LISDFWWRHENWTDQWFVASFEIGNYHDSDLSYCSVCVYREAPAREVSSGKLSAVDDCRRPFLDEAARDCNARGTSRSPLALR
jgi:hypothetical protein